VGALSPWHLILVLGIALIVLGPGKLPETGAAIGKAIRTFQDAVNGRDEITAAHAATAAGAMAPAPATVPSPATAAPAGAPAPIGHAVAPAAEEAVPSAPSGRQVG
jgi:sec-independent protein translocase protein TatA